MAHRKSEPLPLTHDALVARAGRWLAKTKRCACVATELHVAGVLEEIPDAIGWKYGKSTLIECKISRADFLADLKKPFRVDPSKGMGQWRYYLTPPGLLSEEEIPDGWGLLEAHPTQIRIVRESRPSDSERFWEPPFPTCHEQEVIILLSILRRASGGGILGRAAVFIDPE